MYLDDVAAVIRSHVPAELIPQGDADELFRIYAVLLRAKGAAVTRSDIHDAWSAWIAKRNSSHPSLVEYKLLDLDTQAQDSVFELAVRSAAEQLAHIHAPDAKFANVLFPAGLPKDPDSRKQTLDLYKMMVDSSERLVGRRQGVNTFFLTINGALLTASGIIVQGSAGSRMSALGISVLAITGVILCLAWRSLILSFGQLNAGKFRVINAIEPHLQVAIYAAEWDALERGKNPEVYRSFTSREIWVPNVFIVLYSAAAILAILVAAAVMKLNLIGQAADHFSGWV